MAETGANALKCHVCPMSEAGAAQMAGCCLGRNSGIRNKKFFAHFKQETNNE